MRFKTSTFVKYALWLFNVIFLLCGVALIAVGSLILSKISQIKKVPDFDFLELKLIPCLIVILGCCMCMIALIGFCGATRENVCCLTMYSSITLVVFFIQLALIIYIHLERAHLEERLNKTVKDLWDLEIKNKDANPFSIIEVTFDCCGHEGYRKDYLEQGSKIVPGSCCGEPKENTCPSSVYIHKKSCQIIAKTFWKKYLNKVLYVGIAVAVIEFIAFVFGCCLAANIRKLGNYY